jgi:hypothetical protein
MCKIMVPAAPASVVATGYRLGDRKIGVLFPDRLWGSSSPVFNGYRGLLLRELRLRGVKLTTNLHLMSRLRMRGAIPPLPYALS